MKRKIICFVAILALISTSVFAQDTFYKKGDQKVTFNVGPSIPDFIYFFNTTPTSHPQNFYPGLDVLKIGGYGSVNFDFFYNDTSTLGLEVGYDFHYDKGNVLYSNVPILFNHTYTPIQSGKWDVSLSTGLGLSFNTRDNQTLATLITSLKLNTSYFFNQNWGLGLTSGINAVPHFNYTSELSEDNGIIAYSPVTISLTFRN